MGWALQAEYQERQRHSVTPSVHSTALLPSLLSNAGEARSLRSLGCISTKAPPPEGRLVTGRKVSMMPGSPDILQRGANVSPCPYHSIPSGGPHTRAVTKRTTEAVRASLGCRQDVL